jgi:hypothetical protein
VDTKTPPRQTLLEMEKELGTLFFEREEKIRGLICALLYGEYVLLLGPPGSAKSELAQELCSRISGPPTSACNSPAPRPLKSSLGRSPRSPWSRTLPGIMTFKCRLASCGDRPPAVLRNLSGQTGVHPTFGSCFVGNGFAVALALARAAPSTSV